MKVTGWTSWEDNEYTDANNLTTDDFFNVEETVINEIRKKEYKFSGKYHQNGENGCPVIDNKYIYKVSMRKWGSIMAKAHCANYNDHFAYVSWAWGIPNNETPKYPH